MERAVWMLSWHPVYWVPQNDRFGPSCQNFSWKWILSLCVRITQHLPTASSVEHLVFSSKKMTPRGFIGKILYIFNSYLCVYTGISLLKQVWFPQCHKNAASAIMQLCHSILPSVKTCDYMMLRSWLIFSSAFNLDPFTLHIYLAFSSGRAAAADKWADLFFWKQKDSAPKPSSLQAGQKAKVRFQYADSTEGSWKSPSPPGPPTSLCSDAWSQPTVGIRQSKQQKPTSAKSGDSSALQTRIQAGRTPGRAATHDRSCLWRSTEPAESRGSLRHLHTLQLRWPRDSGHTLHRAQPYQLQLVPVKGLILSAFKSNSWNSRVLVQLLAAPLQCMYPALLLVF